MNRKPQIEISDVPEPGYAKVVGSSLLLVFFSAVIAYYKAFGAHAGYDDEGEFLMWLKQLFDGAPLYDRIHMQYGPLYYACEWIAHAVTGVKLSSDSLRFVSISFWVAAALLAFFLVYKLTGSLAIAAGSHLLAFRAMGFIGIEPGHPQELCITLLLGLGLAACWSRRRAVQMALMGALTGALFATKINAGLYAAMALTVVFVFAWRPGRWRSVVLPIFCALVLAFPVLLMRSHLTQSWAANYAMVVVISLAAAMLAASRLKMDETLDLRDMVLAGAGFAIAAGASCAFAFAHGSTARGMFQWLVVFPGTTFLNGGWFTEARIRTVAIPWAMSGLALAGYASRRPNVAVLSWLKLAFAATVALVCAGDHYDAVLSFAPPFLWLVMILPDGSEPARREGFARLALAFLAVANLLYAYPVAGSQVPFTAVMIIVAAGVCLYDALRFVSAWNIPGMTLPARAGRVIAGLSLIVVYAGYAWGDYRAYRTYQSLELVNFPGASRLRLPPQQVAVLRALIASTGSCSTLITLPQAFSLNFWSGKPPVLALASYTALSGLSGEDRRALALILSDRNACLIYSRTWMDFWTRGKGVSSLPVARSILEEFETVFETGEYQFMRRKHPAAGE